MATWKKLLVSGSDISQLNNDAGYITAAEGSNLQVLSIEIDYEGLTFSEAVKSVQDPRQIARDYINQQTIFTVPAGFLPITKIAFQAETTQIIDGVPQVVGHILEQQTILNLGAREYGVGTPPVTAGNFTVLTSTFNNPQTLIDVSSTFGNDEGDLIVADLTVIRSVFNDAPNCVIRSSAVVTATVGDTTRNWLFTGGEGMWGFDAKQALRDDMFFEIENQDAVLFTREKIFENEKITIKEFFQYNLVSILIIEGTINNKGKINIL